MSEFKLGFQSVHTNEITWVTGASGEVARFNKEELAREEEAQESMFSSLLAKKRQLDPQAKLNTRVVTAPIA